MVLSYFWRLKRPLIIQFESTRTDSPCVYCDKEVYLQSFRFKNGWNNLNSGYRRIQIVHWIKCRIKPVHWGKVRGSIDLNSPSTRKVGHFWLYYRNKIIDSVLPKGGKIFENFSKCWFSFNWVKGMTSVVFETFYFLNFLNYLDILKRNPSENQDEN